MADLERATTFTGYEGMADQDPIIDEEHWNWPVLLTRVFCFFLLFLIVICVALEEISRRFLVLAAIICGVLVIVIVATYIDPRKWWAIICRRQPAEPTPARTIRGSHGGSNRTDYNPPRYNNRPTTIPATVVNVSVDNPIQMVERHSNLTAQDASRR
jgi:hypothetical protein